MINAKWLTKLYSFPKSNMSPDSSVAKKGNFVVYNIDKKRFEVPLEYLSNNVIGELLRLFKEEFGPPTDGPITLPCDSTFLKYVISLVRGSVAENDLLTSMATCLFSASSSLTLRQSNQPSLIYSF